MKTIVSESREEAEEDERADESDIKIYTDGSGAGGQIGAAAVLTHGPRPIRVARYHLGPTSRHTVFEGECVGQILALRMLQENNYGLHGTSVMIATDNQATIASHASRKPRTGRHLMDEAEKILHAVTKKWPTLKITM